MTGDTDENGKSTIVEIIETYQPAVLLQRKRFSRSTIVEIIETYQPNAWAEEDEEIYNSRNY